MAARSRLQRDIDAFRARLVRMEAQATDALSAAYADTLATLDTQIVAIAEQIASAQAAGEAVSPSWLFQQARYQELRRQVLRQMERYAAQTQAVITAAQHAVILASLQQAGVVLAPVSGGSGELAQLITSWAQLPERSIANMVGALQQGTPLEQSLARFGVDAAMQAQRTLVRGLALGWGADKTAREVRSSLGITRTAAERLTRTETMRAARTAAMAAYEQSGVVTMVRWSASLSARTCGYCLSRHGTLYPLGTIMATHPNCRCVWTPYNPAWSEVWQSGEAWLAEQSSAVQRRVLGVEGARAFAAGELALADFEVTGTDPDWGPFGGFGGLAHAQRKAAV